MLLCIYLRLSENHELTETAVDIPFFFSQEFDPVRHILEQIPSEENEPAYFEEQVSFFIDLFLLSIMYVALSLPLICLM